MAKKFVVALEIRSSVSWEVEIKTEYFEIGPLYDPYHYRGEFHPIQTVNDKDEAFKFETRAAAEVIAALYCGRVETV